jgi:hypothetical protein
MSIRSQTTYIWDRVKSTAKFRGIEVTVTQAQVLALAAMPCAYCGCPPEPKKGGSYGRGAWNGLDRIDSAKGYLPDNVLPCCVTCNRAKGDLSVAEFMQWATRLGRAAADGGSVSLEAARAAALEAVTNPPAAAIAASGKRLRRAEAEMLWNSLATQATRVALVPGRMVGSGLLGHETELE